MFPEYRHLMTHLKKTHPRFQSLFARHNQLDHEIIRLEGTAGLGYCDNVVRLKNCISKMRSTKFCWLKALPANAAAKYGNM